MSNFNNVTMGTGEMWYNNILVGFLKEEVKYEYNYEIEYFKAGVPLKLYGSITKEVTAQLTAKLAEINVENLAIASGGLTVNTTLGVSTTFTFVGTFAPFPSATSGVQACVLDVVNVTNIAPNAPVVKYGSGSSTGSANLTAAENDDYLFDPVGALGAMIYRNPGGDIPTLSVFTMVGTYTPVASKSLYLGSRFTLDQKKLVFVHTSPVTGKKKTVTFWKASTNGKVALPFSEGNFVLNEVVLQSIWDDDHPTSPLGTYEEEV